MISKVKCGKSKLDTMLCLQYLTQASTEHNNPLRGRSSMVLDHSSRPRYSDRGASCALDRLRHRYALHQPMPSVPAPREMLRYIKTHGLMLSDTSYTYLSY
jgi:hypothetical protein